MKNASRRLIYCTEHTGSVHARLSDRKRAPYMPFGRQSERIARTAYLGAVLENNYGYCLGNGKRLYLPSLGRFCSPDLLSPFGGGGLNSYSYAMLDPVNRHDISGRIPQLFSSIKKTLSNLGGFIGDIAGFGETKNVTIISDTLYTFVDLTKKGPRLNIVSHGAIIDGKPYVQLSKDMIAPPEQMLRKISEKILSICSGGAIMSFDS